MSPVVDMGTGHNLRRRRFEEKTHFLFLSSLLRMSAYLFLLFGRHTQVLDSSVDSLLGWCGCFPVSQLRLFRFCVFCFLG
jgi:hypothetical protein